MAAIFEALPREKPRPDRNTLTDLETEQFDHPGILVGPRSGGINDGFGPGIGKTRRIS